jgi:predicted dehydrogenase/threonine dehydrogenase-like Zn-dependent dehydrogenase
VKQILQSAKTGELELVEVPAPALREGCVLVRTHYSVLSPGTEKLALDFARKSLLGKARSRPDLVRQVVRKLRQEGPLPTYRAVMTRLEAPQPLGYSSAGVVLAVGDGVEGFAPGDRVACAGAGYASHAEQVVVPENLCVRVPDGVPLEQAAFATIGAIALQGLRIAQPTLGEIAVVVGLGLIGQLAVQLLRANGCRVLGLDLSPDRVKQALDQGATWAERPDSLGATWRDAAAGGYGADLALVAAAAESAAPIQLAAELCRHKGRVVVVGAMPMELDRRTFYEKELELRMSTSYGPGRYDRTYEELGLDYPLPYVRWTENRNLGAFLELVAAGSVAPARLDAETVPIDDAVRVYDELAKGARRSLGVVFRYAGSDAVAARSIRLAAPAAPAKSALGLACIGAGLYAKGVLLPNLPASAVARRWMVAATGPSARSTAEKFGFAACGTDPEEALADPAVDLVIVATRHDSHASLAARALRAGKAVWLEKPPALDAAQLAELESAVVETGGFLTVGYNRRFSAHARAMRAAFASRRGPLAIHYVVAAGPPPAGTWIVDPKQGGGRIVGEVCHFVDLCAYLVGTPPTTAFASVLGRDPELDDSLAAQIGFADGSVAQIQYLARASADLPKERFEASADGRTAACENFRTTTGAGARPLRTTNQDKGQATAIREVLEAVRTRAPSPIPWAEVAAVSRATFALLASARSGGEISVG